MGNRKWEIEGIDVFTVLVLDSWFLVPGFHISNLISHLHNLPQL
jgi:hypothetical protein